MQVCPQATVCVLVLLYVSFFLLYIWGGWRRDNDGACEGRNGLSKQVSDWELKDSAIMALLRRFLGATKALLSLYEGAITMLYLKALIKALLRLYVTEELLRGSVEAILRLY
jgi:hypothetical protein